MLVPKRFPIGFGGTRAWRFVRFHLVSWQSVTGSGFYRTFVRSKAVLQRVNGVFDTVKMEHSRQLSIHVSGPNKTVAQLWTFWRAVISFQSHTVLIYNDNNNNKKKKIYMEWRKYKKYIFKRHSIKISKRKKKIWIYKFYDLGQHIFLFYTVPSNSYQQDIWQKMFSLFWSCVNVLFFFPSRLGTAECNLSSTAQVLCASLLAHFPARSQCERVLTHF